MNKLDSDGGQVMALQTGRSWLSKLHVYYYTCNTIITGVCFHYRTELYGAYVSINIITCCILSIVPP